MKVVYEDGLLENVLAFVFPRNRLYVQARSPAKSFVGTSFHNNWIFA